MSTHDEGWESRVNRLERQLAEAEGKLKRIEVEACICDKLTGRPYGCIAHDKQSVIARILKES